MNDLTSTLLIVQLSNVILGFFVSELPIDRAIKKSLLGLGLVIAIFIQVLHYLTQ
jgi:hypothetical protein